MQPPALVLVQQCATVRLLAPGAGTVRNAELLSFTNRIIIVHASPLTTNRLLSPLLRLPFHAFDSAQQRDRVVLPPGPRLRVPFIAPSVLALRPACGEPPLFLQPFSNHHSIPPVRHSQSPPHPEPTVI